MATNIGNRERVKKWRLNDPEGRDRYLRDCQKTSEDIYRSLRENRDRLSENEQLSIAETAEYLEDKSIGIEGIDF